MDQMKRYAVYYAPRPGAFADATAQWLGWDSTTGLAVPQPAVPQLYAPLDAITADPRRYGFHGTLRAPFRLAQGISGLHLAQCVSDLARTLAPVVCDGLRLENLHGFVALTPSGCEAALLQLAALVVERTNILRAPLTEAERARRRPQSLTTRQRNLLDQWGYPHVMEEFQFHLTLTGPLPDDQAAAVQASAAAHLSPVLPRPFTIEDLCVFGEDAAGRFHLIHRYPLSG